MRRRELLFGLAATGAVASRAGEMLGAVLPSRQGAVRAIPTEKQRAWQELELGMFVHFAPNTWQDVESDDLSTSLAKIDPARLSADQWAETAVALGARYLVFVAKHQGGFCMWQTKTTEYSIRNTPWKGGKGDVLAEVQASCRKLGLKLGVYVCPRDDHFGAGTGGVCKTLELQVKYDAMYREQLTEVFTRYGEFVEIWFDGSTVTPVGDLLAKYQPGAMVFQGPQATIRWVGNEDGFAPYPCWNGIDAADAKSGTSTSLDGDPNGDVWMPNEVDVSIRWPDWFWSTKNESKVLTVEQLMSIYYRSVGRGAQLLLNLPANRDGLLAAPDCRVAAAFGTEVRRRFGKPIAAKGGKGDRLLLTFDTPARIDTVVLQEDTALGERVRGYRLEGRVDGVWKRLGEGSAIGHRRIQPVTARVVDAVRLTVNEAAAAPLIRTFAVFDTGVAPPADWDAVTSVWEQNLVGQWSAGRFSVDLTRAIHVAAQYVLRFKPVAGRVTGFEDVVLLIGETSNSALVRRSPGRSDELLLDVTGLAGSIRISGEVEGVASGSILLERR